MSNRKVDSEVRAAILDLGSTKTLSTKQIANRLCLSEDTVKKYLPREMWANAVPGSAFKKLGNKMCHAGVNLKPDDE